MIGADEARATAARMSVRGDQCCWIDLEMACRIGVDIGCGQRVRDEAVIAKQQTAYLPLREGGHMRDDRIQQRP